MRIPINREKNEEEKKKERAREKQRLQNKDAEIKLVLDIYRVLRGIEKMTLAIKKKFSNSEVANMEADEEGIEKRDNEREEEDNATLSGDGEYSQKRKGEIFSSTDDLPSFSGTRD